MKTCGVYVTTDPFKALEAVCGLQETTRQLKSQCNERKAQDLLKKPEAKNVFCGSKGQSGFLCAVVWMKAASSTPRGC